MSASPVDTRSVRRPRIIVIGAGISGLAAAHRIARDGGNVELTVLEAQSRAGGNVVTERRDAFLLDGGPDSFVRTKAEGQRLVTELGLEGDLVSPRSRRVYVAWRGGLAPFPAGMSLAIPTRLGPMLETPLLSWEAKTRALADLLLPSGWGRPPGEEESIASFIRRRFGDEAATVIAGPLLGGIYAGDVEALSIEATFPQLAALEARHGSLIRGLFAAQQRAHRARGKPPGEALPVARAGLVGWLRRGEDGARSPFLTLRHGLGTLISALVDRLPPGALQTDVEGIAIEETGGGFAVRRRRGAPLLADAVIVTTPAHVAARLIPDPRLSSELAAIPYAGTATVFFALEASAVRRPLDGVGFIVPQGEARIIAGTWVSSKWPGRAPGGGVLLRAFLGGYRDRAVLDEHDDAGLAALAWRDLERLMGPLGVPRFQRVFRYAAANPQPVLGHTGRLARIAARLTAHPGLWLAGAAYDGVGIPDCIRQGETAARAALAHVRAPV